MSFFKRVLNKTKAMQTYRNNGYRSNNEIARSITPSSFNPPKPVINKNDGYGVVIGAKGEDGFNALLKANPKIWAVLNNKVRELGFSNNFNINTEYLWVNKDTESYLPYDFIINGLCQKINQTWKVQMNEFGPVVLIDVKTTSWNTQEFHRSTTEINSINQILNTNSKVLYFVAIIYIKQINDDGLDLNNLNNWKVRFLPSFALNNYRISSNENGDTYKYDWTVDLNK